MSATGLDCAETFRRLDDYLDRELGPEEQAAVVAHLTRCAICAEEFAVERDLLAGIRDKLTRIRAPDGLVRRIMARLDEV